MKVLIPILIGLVVVGCGKKETVEPEAKSKSPSTSPAQEANKTQPKTKPTIDKTNKETPSKGDDKNSTKAKAALKQPAKELTLEEKVVGVYEMDGKKVGFLENGRFKAEYLSNVKNEEVTWKIVGKEVHVDDKTGEGGVLKIEANGDLTAIAKIEDGERTDLPKEEQVAFKKIKLDTAAENKKHNVVVGSYERNVFGFDTFKLVLHENGKSETWKNGEKRFYGTWEIVRKDVHVVFEKYTAVYKIEPNGDLTGIEVVEDGKREKYPKEKQRTYKKLSEAEIKRQKAWLENNYVVGTYVAKIEEDAVLELTLNKRNESTWKIVGREVHHGEVMFDSKTRRLQELRTKVYRIEANGDLTEIANIVNGKRTEIPKEEQVTFKKFNWQSAPKRD